MAAYRQAKRMQRGVSIGYGENNVTGTNKFNMPPISIGTSDFTLEYFGNAYGSSISRANVFLYQAGKINIGSGDLGVNEVYSVSLAGVSSRIFRWKGQTNDEKFHLVIARIGSTYTVTINNVLQDTVDMGEVKDLGNFSPVIMNSSDVSFVRVWNYALSADEIATIYSNGDPMGYVVPKAKRDGLLAEYLPQNMMESRKGPEVEPMAETYEFNIGSPYSQTVVSGRQYPFDCIYRVDYVVEEWDFQPSVYRLIGFYGESGASVVAGVSSWIRKSNAKIGEVQSCFIKMPNEGNPSILLYGDQDRDITTARRLKVTIVGITPVSVPISWLDSAKQMPLSDEYMEPLFQSIGGYDMAANGAPEILYNE